MLKARACGVFSLEWGGDIILGWFAWCVVDAGVAGVRGACCLWCGVYGVLV